MPARQGAAWYGNRRVGTVREDEKHTLRFAYVADWLDNGGFPVSINLPLSNGDEEVDAHAFFEGLLPEGKVRQRICRQRKIAIEDDAGLLFAIGEDCAGALSILPDDVPPNTEYKNPEILTTEQIDQLVLSLGAEPVSTGKAQRFSLAGVQEKQPVIFDGNSYGLPDRLNPSSHILKFETLPRVCFAEYMANNMAKRIGLPVVETEYLRTEGADEAVPYLRIKRYDRLLDQSNHLQRMHQEDLLQALGLPVILKYQHDGGPSIRNVAVVLREHTAQPVVSLEFLRDWQIFNYLIGNWDGHAKNLALLYKPGQSVPVLAPFYDLVAIEFFNLIRRGSWARTLAFNIGEHDIPERITRADWEAFARDLGMPPKRLLERAGELANQLPDIAAAVREKFVEEFGDEPVYDNMERSVRQRCSWFLKTVTAK